MPVKPRPQATRFWEKVDVGDCWVWTAAINDSGYGIFTLPGDGEWRNERAHRWSWEHLVGGIPDGHDLDHLCRVRSCVNPDHLQPVTRQENLRRGVGNAAKTHCPQGHPYAGSNLIIERCSTSVDGRSRKCRTCKNARRRKGRRS